MSWSFDQAAEVVLKETHTLLTTLDAEKVKRLIAHVEKDWPEKRLFFWARGRSFLVLRGFAMRLMHMGYEVHIVGEVDCPAIGEGDILIVASGSGGTSSVLLLVDKARQFGAQIVAITGRPNSPLQEKTDEVVEFNPEKAGDSVQLYSNGGGTRFEHSLMLFLDSVILSLVFSRREEAYQEMLKRHANLE
ncbi:MAG: 6-phospho-3-hexuloisomerase [Candidatus Atribacteria bacterium]|nr:6-phospho-3-hexuloisomerase [Candidatus Atribacteria bacterium]